MRKLSADDGFALVPAITVMMVVLLLGTALLTKVNAQTSQSATERAQEGSFQLADGALTAQLEQLEHTWPGSGSPYSTCDQSATSSDTCMGTELAANYTALAAGSPNGGADFASDPQWSTRVIDDADGPEFYDDDLAGTDVCACDENGNGSVWVRAEANVGGKRAVLVSLASQGDPRLETLPRVVILAGSFGTTNNGKKIIVDAMGNSATAGSVAVRCSASGPSKNDPCLGYDPKKGQLSPEDAYQTSYVDGTGTPDAANRYSLDAAAMNRLRATAKSLGSYYATGCPSSLTGQMIFIENPTNGFCSFTGNTVYNSAADPGVVIVAGGGLNVGGGTTYHGLIYAANRQGTAPGSGPCTPAYENDVINLGGDTQIFGAILVDKCGRVNAGSSKVNVVFDANVFAGVTSLSPASGVKNSFRIIPTS